MAISPVLIKLSTKVLSTKGNNEIVSSTFIAVFANGAEKWLNLTKKQPIGLRKESDTNTILLKENCALYWKDWSKNPTVGTWDKNYPISIFPQEIINLFN